jgi:hypothetical protein
MLVLLQMVGRVPRLSVKNASSVNLSLQDRGTAGDASKKPEVNSLAARAGEVDNEKHDISVDHNLERDRRLLLGRASQAENVNTC